MDHKAIIKSKKAVKRETKAGEFSTIGRAIVQGYKLSQFVLQKKSNKCFCLFIKQNLYRHNVILGWNLMKKLGIDLLYNSGNIKWGGIYVPMVPMGQFFAKQESKEKTRVFVTAQI